MIDEQAFIQTLQSVPDVHPQQVTAVLEAYLGHRPAFDDFEDQEKLVAALQSIGGRFMKHGNTEEANLVLDLVPRVRRLMLEIEELATATLSALEARREAQRLTAMLPEHVIKMRVDQERNATVGEIQVMLAAAIKSGSIGLRALGMSLRDQLDTLRAQP